MLCIADSNKNIEMDLSTTSECQNMVQATVGHYDTNAHDFWTGTKDHDVTQNRTAFLEAMGEPLAGKRVLVWTLIVRKDACITIAIVHGL